MAKVRAKPKVRNLSNATPGFLIDEIGRVRDEKKVLEKEEGLLKEALKARLEPDEYTVEGDSYVGMLETVTQMRFQADLAKEFLTEKQAEECYEETSYIMISTSKKNGNGGKSK